MAIDVTTETFEREVLDRSEQVPVLVDFWADWCGPCHRLAPVLEQAVDERGGDVVLAKVNTEESPQLAQAFGIQGIPAVKAFVNREVVDEFVGAQAPPTVKAFISGLVPSETDQLVAGGGEEALREALAKDPGHRDARFALARILAGRGEGEEALGLLAELGDGDFAAAGLAAQIELSASEDPDIREALEFLTKGEVGHGVEGLLAALLDADEAQKDLLRRAIVGVLSELPDTDERAAAYRKRLAALLY